jgi:hypothetical protein
MKYIEGNSNFKQPQPFFFIILVEPHIKMEKGFSSSIFLFNILPNNFSY